MTTDPSRRELPSTYFVQDRSNEDEFARLQVLDRMLTTGMGGVLPEQPDPTRFKRVLDVGCGTGGWLIEAAKQYHHMTQLIGVDANKHQVEYARVRAATQQVGDRVEFHAMDALLILEFPDGYFDLVNHRAAASWLRTWDWSKLLSEYHRVCKPGGIIRITESDFNVFNAQQEKSTPALTRLVELTTQVFYQSGHLMTPVSDGVLTQLPDLLRRHGVQNVQTRAHLLEFPAGTPTGHDFYEDIKLGYRTVLPFFRKWTRVPDNYEALYQQMLTEIQQPDFVGSWSLLTAWGQC